MKSRYFDLKDEELMIAYQSGDEQAFSALYARFAPKFYGFFLARVKNRTIADDLHQQAFLKLHKSRGTYKQTHKFSPWAFAICNSVLIDNYRANKNDKFLLATEQIVDLTTDQKIDQTTYQTIDQAYEPSAAAIESTELNARLESLSSRERQAIEGRYIHDLSFSEIGRRLNTTAVNSRKVISRALQKLKRAGGD